MKHLEIITVEHKGIEICLKIDYDTGLISIVDGNKNAQYGLYGKKNWVFMERGVEYMQGWLDILDAMKKAVTEAKRLVEEDVKKKDAEVEKQHLRIAKLSSKEK